MTVCSLCLSIPVNNLPDFPTSYTTHLNGWKRINDFQLAHGAPKPRGLLGFPHRPDLQSLRTAAAGCGLCRLILAQIDLVVEEFRVASQDNFFLQNHTAGYPTFDLFLARRRDTGHGFLILCHSTVRKVVYLLGAIGLSVRDDDPLATAMPGRVVDGTPGNKATLNRAAKWLQDCEQHSECRPPSLSLPRRVIDVGEDSDSQTVQLVEPAEGTSERYIALSHCWGRSNLPLTTTKNKPQRLEGISLSAMSRSFEDAITVARFLGVRYVWIDSLCIVQDDAQDWDAEAAKMHLVYSNSFLTISVTGAKDGSIGCFAHRAPREYVRLPHTDKSGTRGEIYACGIPVDKEVDTANYINMDDEPLSARGWCFQERVLSRRVLHFASDQMYFECMEGFRSEDGLCLPRRYFTMHGSRATHHLPGPSRPNPNPHLEQWHLILWSYGPRMLTKGSDKLPALGGIAAMFAERLDDLYLAGIWRKSVIEGLLWQALGFAEVEEDRIVPSWSWAAINGIPAYGGLTGRWEPLGCVLDCRVELEGKSVFGPVKSGRIKMEAPLLPVVLVDSQNHAKDTGEGFPQNPKHLYFRTTRGTGSESYGRFDFVGRRHAETESLAREDGKVFALVLAVNVGDSSSLVQPLYHALLVMPVGDKDNKTLRRLGFVHLGVNTLGEDEVRSSRTIITLV